MPERQRFDREIADLGLREYWGLPVVPPPPPPTLGFEFDVHFGLIKEVVADAGKTMPANGAQITNHDEATHGFRVKLDGPRLEIATKPFTVDDAGKKELDETITKVLEFAKKLKQACKAAPEKAITVPGVSGRPRPFTLAETLVSGLPIVRLPFNKRFHPTNCTVWASPQATLTVRLSKVDALVQAIKNTEGKGPGIALTGDNDSVRWRMGLRSEALYNARREVGRMFRDLDSKRPRLVLSDHTEVNKKTLNDHLRGFLILLATYLWTSELRYDFDETHKGFDFEPFAKAYLPVNVKAPFGEICRKLMNPTERLLFKEIFAVGIPRQRLFKLAKRDATTADGSRKLFPPGPKELGLDSVHERQKAEFGSVPTWDDLVEHTLNSGHKGWGDRLLVPISKKIGIDKTWPRVAVELRRIGFNAVFDHQWKGLMNRIFTMTKKLDS